MDAQRFTVYDIFRRNAFVRHDATAVIQADNRLTHHELWMVVEELAAGLAELGLRRGETVAVLARNDTTYLVLYGACAKLGLVAYPVNWRLTAGEIERVLERARPRMLVVDASTAETVAGWPQRKPEIPYWYQMGERPAPGFTSFDRLFLPDRASEHVAGGNDAFAVISTAAVDVIPRGAVLSHSNVVAANLQSIAAMGLGEDDVYLAGLPMYHIAALGKLLAVLHAGGAVVIVPRYDAAEAVELIDEHGVTLLSDFPPVLLNLLGAAEERRSGLASLRIVSGLDAPETIERLHRQTGATFWTGFGQSETTGWVTLQPWPQRPGSAGQALPVCQVRLLDEYDREVAPGTPGEIVVRGPTVFHGYHAQPDVTEVTFRGGWHHTGDIGRFDEEGYLYYVKRKAEKELIKPGGENVYPAEVEQVILELEGVSAVAVIGVPDPQWGEAIKAVVEVERPGALTPEQVTDHVGGRIARYKKPRQVEFTEALPRTEDDAVDREAVKERWGQPES